MQIAVGGLFTYSYNVVYSSATKNRVKHPLSITGVFSNSEGMQTLPLIWTKLFGGKKT